MLPLRSIQRYRLLITPVITTKPASSDLIIRAPTEKTTQVKNWLHIQLLRLGASRKPTSLKPPSIDFKGADDFTSPSLLPTCSASFLLILPSKLPPLTPSPICLLLSPLVCTQHSELPAFRLLCWTRVSLSACTAFTSPVAWLIPLKVCGGHHILASLLGLCNF